MVYKSISIPITIVSFLYSKKQSSACTQPLTLDYDMDHPYPMWAVGTPVTGRSISKDSMNLEPILLLKFGTILQWSHTGKTQLGRSFQDFRSFVVVRFEGRIWKDLPGLIAFFTTHAWIMDMCSKLIPNIV